MRRWALMLLLLQRAASFSARELKRARLDSARPKAKQSLGQNFLVDVHLARKIASSVVPAGDDGCRVIELGPGQGALTGHLLERFPKMSATTWMLRSRRSTCAGWRMRCTRLSSSDVLYTLGGL